MAASVARKLVPFIIPRVTWIPKSTSTSWKPLSSRTAQSGFILQRDNYPKHKSKLLTKSFHDNIVPLLLWLSRSPDFNPIEDLWDILELQVEDPVAHREHEKFTKLTTAEKARSHSVKCHKPSCGNI
ncbi:hypothetical protein TELCIR_02609 [Teladorsagia circumcincta]|uniref:Tc1-like transposase DDE domain-containing protein n=1 Tax=Teladorsagia circumcincta TaxID=45464 RepID=A0A2G9UYP4_TELCI|nr:hypothetical protein TELCIR_02609 [Teladorsagia circumcincta]